MTSEQWQRQDSDTDASFKAFNIYLRMERRSLQKAADNYYAKTSSNRRHFQQWSSDHNWVNRVQAYDAHLEAIDLADYEDKRLASRHKRQSIVQGLEGLLSRVMTEHQNKLDPQTINQIAAASSKILDQSRQEFNDLPTQRKELTGKNGGAIEYSKAIKAEELSDDELAAIATSLASKSDS